MCFTYKYNFVDLDLYLASAISQLEIFKDYILDYIIHTTKYVEELRSIRVHPGLPWEFFFSFRVYVDCRYMAEYYLLFIE